MKKLIVIVALFLMMPAWVSAQNVDHEYHAEGYAFAAWEKTVGPTGGGGGEYFVYKGFGLGGEFAKGAPFGEQIISTNAYFGAPSTSKNKVEPFVTGGYTHFSVGNLGPPPAEGFNIGAGASLWLTKHAALRLEGRVTHGGRSLSIEYEPSGNFYTAPNDVVSFRIGVTFR